MDLKNWPSRLTEVAVSVLRPVGRLRGSDSRPNRDDVLTIAGQGLDADVMVTRTESNDPAVHHAHPSQGRTRESGVGLRRHGLTDDQVRCAARL